jgi:hypothetical protein
MKKITLNMRILTRKDPPDLAESNIVFEVDVE